MQEIRLCTDRRRLLLKIGPVSGAKDEVWAMFSIRHQTPTPSGVASVNVGYHHLPSYTSYSSVIYLPFRRHEYRVDCTQMRVGYLRHGYICSGWRMQNSQAPCFAMMAGFAVGEAVRQHPLPSILVHFHTSCDMVRS